MLVEGIVMLSALHLPFAVPVADSCVRGALSQTIVCPVEMPFGKAWTSGRSKPADHYATFLQGVDPRR